MRNKFLLVFLIFLFSISIRLWNLNKMGRTWDEGAQVEYGNRYVHLLAKRKINDPLFIRTSEHPPMSKYIYGFFSLFDQKGLDKNGQAIFLYDWTYTRLGSVLFSSFTVLLVVLFCFRYLNNFVGVVAGIILSTLPFYLGLSQIASIESILFFFYTATVFSFAWFIEKFTVKRAIITGIILGFALASKYTNVLLIPTIVFIYIAKCMYGKINVNLHLKKIFLIILIGCISFAVVWPMPFLHSKEALLFNYTMRSPTLNFSVPEVFLGKVRLVPVWYYLLMFLVTTPLGILIFFYLGNKQMLRNRSLISWIVIIWFVVPFVQSFYNFRQHGIRYIIEIYAPLSIIAAIGLDQLVKQKKLSRTFILSFLIGYSLLTVKKISPYYLDYYNELVGGPKIVSDTRLFQIGWWGEGIREAAYYVRDHGKKGSKLGLAVVPLEITPQLEGFKVEKFDETKIYDYILVSSYNITREGFDDTQIKKMYKPTYYVKADGAVLVTVYKREEL